MNTFQSKLFRWVFCLLPISGFAQTDIDAIMMPKHNFCGGLLYSNSKWDNYWEGTFKRNNLNIGTVTTQMTGIMGNYGITDNLNVLFGLPYVKTKASAGTLKGQKGLQDLSLTVKYMPIEESLGNGIFSIYTIGSVSMPVSNYVADYLPLSIGMHSNTATFRLMTDYQLEQGWFASASAAYIARANVKIDRTAYFTTVMHYSNKVALPDVASFNFRLGYRDEHLIAEAILDRWNTMGGFDIRKNDMPFLSNEMDATRVGINVKYTFRKIAGLSLIGGGMYTLNARNMGQALQLNGGAFYQMNWGKKAKPSTTETQQPKH
ncbi:MAG: transporter [Ferruginibacter sp.]